MTRSELEVDQTESQMNLPVRAEWRGVQDAEVGEAAKCFARVGFVEVRYSAAEQPGEDGRLWYSGGDSLVDRDQERVWKTID